MDQPTRRATGVGVVVDTSELIEIERKIANPNLTELLPVGALIAAITLGELLLGVGLADTDRRRQERITFVDDLRHAVPVIPFGEAEAREWARIYAELRRAGAMIGERDLQIAATAAAGGHQVLTRNAAEFRRVNGLEVITGGAGE